MRWLPLFVVAITHTAAADSITKTGELAPPKRGLETDVLLHPMDGFTAYTLAQGELVYCQSPLTLPLPSWAWIGVTDWLTAEIDLLPLVGGFFVEPHRPVPSFNFRFRLRDGGARGISLALETMVQHMGQSTVQEDSPYLRIERDGTQVWGRINASIPLTERFRVHISAGATYARSIAITNNDPEMPRGKHHRDLLSPDVSISFDYRMRPWISLHATASHGTTFVYSDNQPRKLEAAYGFRLAPWYASKRGILRATRFEFPAFIMHHRDSGTGHKWYVPLIPYAYWQWNG